MIWIGFQTTFECSLKQIGKNCISWMFFLLRFTHAKYDQIPIGYAQKQIWSLNRAIVHLVYLPRAERQWGGRGLAERANE